MFNEFHQHGQFVKRLNAMFLVLIPKKGGAKELKDYRPINLVSSVYELLARDLANTLKKVGVRWCPAFRMLLWKEGKYLTLL